MALYEIVTQHRIASRATRAGLFQRMKCSKILRWRRRELAALSDRLLGDLGVTRAHADSQASRPIGRI